MTRTFVAVATMQAHPVLRIIELTTWRPRGREAEAPKDIQQQACEGAREDLTQWLDNSWEILKPLIPGDATAKRTLSVAS